MTQPPTRRLSIPCQTTGHQRCTGVAWHPDRTKGPGPCQCDCHTAEQRAAA